MSYSGHRGLGQTPEKSGPLPMWSALPGAFRHGDVEYKKIGDDALLDQMMARLADVGAVSRANVDADTHQFTARRSYRNFFGNQVREIREEGPFVRALRSYWVRMGRPDNWWPGWDTDFGPNTNNSQDLQISKPLYEQLALTGQPKWRLHPDGYVRLLVDDDLYQRGVRDALVADGYLDARAPVTTKDDGPMVQALKAYFDEGVAAVTAGQAQLDYGQWPSGINFGPNTNGDEIRIPEKLLIALLTGNSPRRAVRAAASAAASAAARAAFATATIRPPVIGSPSTRVAFRPGVGTQLVRAPAVTLTSLRTALKGLLS